MCFTQKESMIFEIVTVKTYCGYKLNEEPRSFELHGETFHVKEIIDRWYAAGMHPWQPQYDYYKIIDENDEIFLLRYNRRRDVWSVLVE